MLTIFRNILRHPTQNYEGKKLSGGQAFGYFIVLSLIFAIPLLITSYQAFSSMHDEYVEYTGMMPEFTVQNGEMQTEGEAESFIYQGSDGYVFYFDPNNQIDQQTVENNINTQNGLIGFGFFEDGFRLQALDMSNVITYDQLEGLNKDTLLQLGDYIGSTTSLALVIIIPLIMIFMALFTLGNSLLTYLLTLFIPNTYTFGERFKMTMTALTWPIIVFSLFHLFGLFLFQETTIYTIIAIIFFYNGIRKDPDPTIKKL